MSNETDETLVAALNDQQVNPDQAARKIPGPSLEVRAAVNFHSPHKEIEQERIDKFGVDMEGNIVDPERLKAHLDSLEDLRTETEAEADRNAEEFRREFDVPEKDGEDPITQAPVDDTWLRQLALGEANKFLAPRASAEQIVEAANLFLDFLKGTTS